MTRKSTILLSLAIAVPLVAAVHVKKVSGSEPPGRLVDNGDGTITDSVTHLVWQKTPFTYGQGGAGITSEAGAVAACAGINLGAFPTGWRVPAIKELVSIVDFESATSPMIDTSAFPNTDAQHSYYTTSSSLCVDFANGQILSSCSSEDPLRCVHTGS